MLERQVAELLATYLSRFIEDVNAEQLEISLWSGNVVLNNVHLRADVLERITALLHGEAEGMGGDDTSASPRDSPSGSSAPADAAAAKSAASVRMLLAPFTVVKGIVRHLTIQVPWSSLESEPIHVQISGVELVLGPLRARPFNAWEEQEREEAIKQQQLARYEEERQRLSRGAAGELDSRSSSVASGSGNGGATTAAAAAAASKAKAASSGPSADAFGGSWFSWIWDFDRIGQTALRNVCLTLRDVSLRYEFDYDGLHPTLAKALCVFVREMRVTTTTQSFHETFATDLLAPWCKKIAVSDVVVSTHAMRLSTPPTSQSRQGSVPRAASAGTVGDGDAAAVTDQTEASVTSAPECPSSSVPPSAYETYKSHWAFSSAVLSVAQLELLVKVVPPNVKSLNPIVESAEPLPATATELTVSAVDGVKVTVCFGVFQALESMWRSYHQSLGCARYRKRLHLLRRARRVTPAFETAGVDSTAAEASMELSSSPMLPAPDGPPSRQLARQRWRFALRCVLDDVQQQRQTFQRHERSRREVVEGMVQFCQLRRSYCQYWKRTQGVSWAPPLDALEEKKLALMERQLSLTQVLFLRCLAYGEMLQEQEGHARQQAFIEEARLRKQRAEQDKRRGKASPQGRSGGLWGWFTQSASNEFAAESTRGEAAEHALSAADRSAHSSGTVFGVPAYLDAVPLSRRVADEWALGQRFASPYRAPLVQPSVPQSILPEATGSDPFYLTLRCLVESVTVVFDPVYWPVLNDSSVPPPPQHTPLRHIRQQLHLHLRAIETFFTSVPDDRPDKAAWSLFVSAARVTFEGTPRSVLLQSKEAEGEDFIVVKQNAARTHAAVWVAPLLMVCQPLHDWRWWGEEASAFVAWFTALQRAFYTSNLFPSAASSAVAAQALEDTSTAAGAFSRGARSPSFCSAPPSSGLRYAAQTPVRGAAYTLSDEAPPLTWSVILQSADICVPLFTRDIDDWHLDIVDHAPSGLSSLVMMDSVATALPQRGTSADQEARRFSSVEVGGDKDGVTAPSPSGSRAGARGTVDLHSFLFTGGEVAEEKGRSADGTESLESSVSGSFVSAKPERCFLNDEACLVLSISTTRLCTVPPSKQRSAGEGNEYYLCVGDHDKAVRLFCQLGAARSALSLHRNLELMSFVAGEVLVGPREVSILFNKGINIIVEPDAFAVLSDTLLKPAVFTALDEEAQRVQLLVQDLIAAEAAALGTQPAWRLVDAGRIVERDDGQGGQSAEGVAARHFQPDCLRHIMAAVLAARPASTANPSVPSEHQATEVAGALTIALGVSVVQLLIRSVENEDLAEMLLVAPVEVPAVTAPYRSALSALGAEEPRALELLWRPSAPPVVAATGAAASELPLPYAHPRRDVGEGEEKEDRSGQASGPLFVLSVPDATLTTATGRKLLTVEQLTVVHNTPATPGSVADVTISMDAVEACFDVAVVDLTEVAIGTLGALRPMRRETFAPDAQAAETGAGMAEEEAAFAGLPKLDLLVRSLHVQLPLTLSDAEGTPYVEVNAELAGLRVTVNSSSAQDGQRTWDIHVGFQIDDAVQLIDYVGGDPEVRKLVTPHRWPTQTDVTAMEPLRCDVDIRLGAAQSDAGDAAAAAPSVSAIHVSVHGGAVHVYFPFLYVYVAVLARDQRLRRLARLRQSSLLVRGFTFLAREQLARERRGGVSTASSSPTRRGTEPKAGRRQPQPVEVTAVLTQVDVFLATDAAVPIDLESPDSLCVVRLAEVRAGVSQTLSDAADATTAPRYLRTRAYLDTVSLYLLDLTRAGTKHAQLPNVKVRTEAGVLLVPKTTLTGFTYQRGTRGDTTVLVGVHAALAEGAKESADGAAAASASDVQPKDAESPASSPKASASPVISVDLTAYQCQTLIRVVARNVLQPRVAEVQHGSAVGTMEEAAHSVNSPRRRTAYLQRRSLAGSADDFAEFSDSRPPAAASALTLLVTVPALAFVLRIGSSVRYTLALRRGAQFYSASGGAWSQSPVKNGQLSGLELSARDGEVGDEARERGAAVILFAADLIGVALVEGRPAVSSTTPPAATGTAAGEGGGSRAAEEDADAAPVVRVVAAVRNTTVQVPHVRWWLRLYALCTDPDVAKAETCSVSPGSRAASAPQPSTCTPLSLHESSVSANALGPLPHRRGEGSSQQSSVVLGSRGQSGQRNHAGPGWGRGGRGAHTPSAASSSSRWLCGSLEITNTQFSFGGGETDTGAGITSAQLPWCRVIVPEARIAAAPVRVLNDSGEARLYDEFTFVLPQCPQVLLRASGTAGGATAKGLYVSVLKLHAASTASSLRPTPTPVSAPAGPCVRVQLIWSPDSKLISSLHYGRSYHMTDLALHRTCAVQLQLSGLMLHFPASELFMFAHELLHQSREVHRIFALADTRPSPASRRTRGPARTYAGLEAQLSHVGVVISAESPRTDATAAATPGGSEDSPWCGVTVTSITVATDVELQSVLTNAGEPATLMDDAGAAGWRMCVWHLNSSVAFRGVVLAGHHGATVRWTAPQVDVAASQPLPRTVVCVRPSRDAATDDDSGVLDSEPSSLMLRQRNSTDFFHVEPTAAHVCSELNSHLLTTVRVAVGEPESAEAEVHTAGPPPRCIEMPVSTAYVLGRSALYLVELWQETEKAHAAPVESTPAVEDDGSRTDTHNATRKPLLSRGPVMWYEVRLSLRGHTLRVLSELPPSAAHAAALHCLAEVTITNDIVYQLNRELHGDAFDNPLAEPDSDAEQSASEEDGAAHVSVSEQHRLCVGAVRVWDGKGTLLFLLSGEVTEGEGEAHWAAVADYVQAEQCLRVVADHVLLAASPVTVAFAVEWLRAAQAWLRLWTGAAPAVTTPEGTEPVSVSVFVSLDMEVRQVEVLLPPAGFVIIQRPRLQHTRRQASTPVADAAATAIGDTWELSCAEVALHSTPAVMRSVGHRDRKPELLASVVSPLLRHCSDAGSGATVLCRVPSVTLVNRVRHSWRLCVLRAAACVSAALTLWRATEEAETTPRTRRSPPARLPAVQAVVDRAEVLCHAPTESGVGANPALVVRAEQLQLMLPSDNRPCTASALLSAFGDAGGVAATEQLLERTAVTLRVRGIADLSTTSASRAREVHFAVGGDGVRCHVPSAETLRHVAGALWMVVDQQWQRTASGTSVPSVLGGSFHNVSASPGAKQPPAWTVTLHVARFRCDCYAPIQRQRLAELIVQELHGSYRASRNAERSNFLLHVASIECETDVAEAAAVVEATPAAVTGGAASGSAARLLSVMPRSDLSSPSDNGPLDPWRVGPADAHRFALYAQQQCLPLSHSDGADDAAEHSCADTATALTVRLHLLQMRVPLALAQALCEAVLAPLVRGVRCAAATSSRQALTEAAHSTVLQVRQPRAVMPALDELERHAALVRVVEVHSDWTLREDLHLGGGGGGECALQLRFSNASARHVITVRGDAAEGAAPVTIYLSCCERIDGSLGPAIRVDAEVTVRFAQVRVVVEDRHGHGAATPDAFVELGERALCSFPPPPAAPIASPAVGAPAAAAAPETPSAVEKSDSAGGSGGASRTAWAATSVYSMDLKLGFDAALTAHRRCLAAAGSLQMRYRFEDKRRGGETMRLERDGEATVTLRSCTDEVGDLTRTPLRVVAGLGYGEEHDGRVRMTVNMGTALWRLSMWHVQMLAALGKSLRDCFVRAAPVQPSPAKTAAASAELWTSPAPLPGRPTKLSTIVVATPLDVAVEVPHWALSLTDDLQTPLAVCNVSSARLQCTADTNLSDMVVKAAAVLSVTDRCPRLCPKPLVGDGDGEEDKGLQESMLASSATTRVLLSAKPAVTVVWTRFSADSSSLSISADVEDVVATLPVSTALRALRRAQTGLDSGTRAFWNETGVELLVSPQGTEPSTAAAPCRLSALPAPRVEVTGIPSAAPLLTLTAQPSCGAEGSAGATLDLRDLHADVATRLRLPGYHSPFGALDVLARKAVHGGVAVVRLTTTVELSNAFFAPESDADGKGATVLLRGSAEEAGAVAVPPRGSRCIPLPLLRECLSFEMGSCVYAAPAKLLTWAMVADAMTVLADQVASGASAGGGALASVVEPLRKLGVQAEREDSADGRSGLPPVCGHARLLNATTIAFPVLLQPLPRSVSESLNPTVHSAAEAERAAEGAVAPTSPIRAAAGELSTPPPRVVQLTWRRRRSMQPQLLFSGQLPPCEYTVKVEPVWTLWNCTGCLLRLRVCLPRGRGSSSVTGNTATPHATAQESSAAEAVLPPPTPTATHRVLTSAVVESGTCFQWLPGSLEELQGDVTVFFQVAAPACSPLQWWSAAATLSLREAPPAFIRLQQGSSCPRGALATEQHGSSTVVLRCAALLHSRMPRPVYLRAADKPGPLPGTDAQGCVQPQQTVPLFFSEYAATLAPNAQRVGFVVRETPLHAGSPDEQEETDPYVLSTPVAATVLSADERDDCTLFYAVSALKRDGEEESSAEEAPPEHERALWQPRPPPALQLRPLCVVHNADATRTLFVRPFLRPGAAPTATMSVLTTETAIPPGESREVLRFCPRAEEPEVHLCYSDDAGHPHAHVWLPPVRLLSLATSTVPLVLKHPSNPAAVAAGPAAGAGEFTVFPAPRRAQQQAFATSECCRCLELQSSTAEGRLTVQVRLLATPPLRVVNRLNATLQFAQLVERGATVAGGGSPAPPAAKLGADLVQTALCSAAPPPWSYLVAPESSSYGCWEVPTLEFHGLRVTLHSNTHRGRTVSVDLDLLQCAASPSSGTRVGETDAYVYVSLDHATHQYTVTVIPTRQLEKRMLFQPRRLTQVEVLVPRCTVYVAAVTLPSSGVFSRLSVIARGARGRLRRWGAGKGVDDVVVPVTASDEDVLTLLQQAELDVLCVRVVGVYGSVTMTERNLFGSASLGILEVVDCTMPEAEYPIVLRMAPGPQTNGSASRGGTPSDASAPAASTAADVAAASMEVHDGASLAAGAAGVPRFKDPSWCNVEVQLTRSAVRAAGVVMLPIQQLRISVPPIVVQCHDEFLCTVRAAAERVREEWAATAQPPVPQQPVSAEPLPAASTGDESASGSCPADIHAAQASPRLRGLRTMYNVFFYELSVSAVVVKLTYTRASDRRYSPFRDLGALPVHLIPSMEGLRVSLKPVRLLNVELRSATSFATVVTSFVWPLYRAQLLLQSYKVVGALDFLGNPHALLSSWSRGMWELVTNKSGQSRWAGTSAFLRTTTSSTLHSVGMLARSIGSLTGSSTPAAGVSAGGGGGGGSGGDAAWAATGQRRGVLREVLAEMGGGMADAVWYPLQGAREGGVNGFFMGMASGMAGLVGRPVFGFFRGVGVTSEFYARLLCGQPALTEMEARRLAVARNYHLSPAEPSDAAVASSGYGPTLPGVGHLVLSSAAFEQAMADVARWRRGEEKNVRTAIARVGVQNAALYVGYASTTAFFTHEEFAASLPTALTTLLAARLAAALTQRDARQPSKGGRDARGAEAADGGQGESRLSGSRLAQECHRAAHIKASLGVDALHKYVVADVFVRVCTLHEIADSVSAAELHAKYVILLAKVINSAGDALFTA